jgi:hypothetical protein
MISINDIPPEILFHIFHFSITHTRDDFPLSISHTNRYFRSIALASQLLWSTINTHRLPSLTALRVYLDRSGSCPLHIYLDLTVTGRYTTTSISRPIEILQRHVSRWRTLSIQTNDELVTAHVQTSLQCLEAPMLESISIHPDCRGSEWDFTYDETQIFRGGAPSLTSVRLEHIAFFYLRPPLASITHLELHSDKREYPTLQMRLLHSILSSAISLTHLSISAAHHDPPPTNTPVTLPSLISLRIRSLECGESPFPLRMILAPNLTSLHLSGLDTMFINGSPSANFPLLSSLTISRLFAIHFQTLTLAFPSISVLTTISHQRQIRLLTSHLTSQDRPWRHLRALRLRVLSGRTQERKYDYLKAMRRREDVRVVQIDEGEWTQLRW